MNRPDRDDLMLYILKYASECARDRMKVMGVIEQKACDDKEEFTGAGSQIYRRFFNIAIPVENQEHGDDFQARKRKGLFIRRISMLDRHKKVLS